MVTGQTKAAAAWSGSVMVWRRAQHRACLGTTVFPATALACSLPWPASGRPGEDSSPGVTVQLVTEVLRRGPAGEYQVQAAIAAVHDQANSHAGTDWPKIASLYGLLESMTGNPMVILNRAVSVSMARGPAAGLALTESLDERLGDHHRLHSARAHLHELAGDRTAAIAEFRAAAARAANLRERQYLTTQAARLGRSA